MCPPSRPEAKGGCPLSRCPLCAVSPFKVGVPFQGVPFQGAPCPLSRCLSPFKVPVPLFKVGVPFASTLSRCLCPPRWVGVPLSRPQKVGVPFQGVSLSRCLSLSCPLSRWVSPFKVPVPFPAPLQGGCPFQGAFQKVGVPFQGVSLSRWVSPVPFLSLCDGEWMSGSVAC